MLLPQNRMWCGGREGEEKSSDKKNTNEVKLTKLLSRGRCIRVVVPSAPPDPTMATLSRVDGGDSSDDNPYVAMRSAKIARNEKRLRELGLLSTTTPPARPPKRRAVATTPRYSSINVTPCGPARRSDRLLSLSSTRKVNYKDVMIPIAEALSTKRSSLLPPSPGDGDDASFVTASSDVEMISAAVKTKLVHRSTGMSNPAANSVRSIEIDVEALILGRRTDTADDDCNPRHDDGGGGLLGKMVERTGKECVVNASFTLAASNGDKQRLGGATLSFNKYSGVQEWKNCVYLWVNLNTADSPNDFLDYGRQITWFGGSKMHDQSPAILSLLCLGKKRSSDECKTTTTTKTSGNVMSSETSNVVLWCRRYTPQTKTFTPYVCFGRLGYRSHIPESRPLAFVWDLLDYDGLKFHQNHAVRETFELFTT